VRPARDPQLGRRNLALHCNSGECEEAKQVSVFVKSETFTTNLEAGLSDPGIAYSSTRSLRTGITTEAPLTSKVL